MVGSFGSLEDLQRSGKCLRAASDRSVGAKISQSFIPAVRRKRTYRSSASKAREPPLKRKEETLHGGVCRPTREMKQFEQMKMVLRDPCSVGPLGNCLGDLALEPALYKRLC
ncbi:hypothetical protein QJS10_CPB21g00905 [Acorus calamus]|uniref:Uncharacterized protein n=1 Tax=Acorus calamus TaxID=4465 RepID=A0AAV9C5R6_ACOCL|nr:hypothetical protein QJS10_CPB21g00905 [Acorus calamus]